MLAEFIRFYKHIKRRLKKSKKPLSTKPPIINLRTLKATLINFLPAEKTELNQNFNYKLR